MSTIADMGAETTITPSDLARRFVGLIFVALLFLGCASQPETPLRPDPIVVKDISGRPLAGVFVGMPSPSSHAVPRMPSAQEVKLMKTDQGGRASVRLSDYNIDGVYHFVLIKDGYISRIEKINVSDFRGEIVAQLLSSKFYPDERQ